MSTLVAKYPCCDGPCRVTAPAGRAVVIERRHFCPDDATGTLYQIEITELTSEKHGTVHAVEFLDLASDIAFQLYGTRRVPRRRAA